MRICPLGPKECAWPKGSVIVQHCSSWDVLSITLLMCPVCRSCRLLYIGPWLDCGQLFSLEVLPAMSTKETCLCLTTEICNFPLSSPLKSNFFSKMFS